MSSGIESTIPAVGAREPVRRSAEITTLLLLLMYLFLLSSCSSNDAGSATSTPAEIFDKAYYAVLDQEVSDGQVFGVETQQHVLVIPGMSQNERTVYYIIYIQNDRPRIIQLDEGTIHLPVDSLYPADFVDCSPPGSYILEGVSQLPADMTPVVRRVVIDSPEGEVAGGYDLRDLDVRVCWTPN